MHLDIRQYLNTTGPYEDWPRIFFSNTQSPMSTPTVDIFAPRDVFTLMFLLPIRLAQCCKMETAFHVHCGTPATGDSISYALWYTSYWRQHFMCTVVHQLLETAFHMHCGTPATGDSISYALSHAFPPKALPVGTQHI
jgi:hypothetical protein